MTDLCSQILAGDRRALAKAITLLESSLDADRAKAIVLLKSMSLEKRTSIRVGVCGSPGVGKSTFIDVLGMAFIDSAHKVAVLAVDPSSPISGGSILGDKTRMEKLSMSPAAFIRPSPGRAAPGGVTANTHEVIRLLEFAGFDFIVLETIGIGQSETDVANLVDKVVYLHQPESGDDLQAIKKGILEVSDYFVVTKADGVLKISAEGAAQQLRGVVNDPHQHLNRVFCVSSTEKKGFLEIHDALLADRADQSEIGKKRIRQQRKLFESRLTNDFRSMLSTDQRLQQRINTLESAVSSGLSLREASNTFFADILKN